MAKMKQGDALRAEILERARSEGLQVAYETALQICRDPKAAPQAKATASQALFRLGSGYNASPSPDDKDLHELTPEELQARIDRLYWERTERSRVIDDASAFD